MNKITLGHTNEKVSVISLGAWSYGKENTSGGNVGWANQSDQDSRLALSKAYSCEINHWDTADVYGDGQAEKIIGKMWKVIPRDDIFLATKANFSCVYTKINKNMFKDFLSNPLFLYERCHRFCSSHL